MQSKQLSNPQLLNAHAYVAKHVFFIRNAAKISERKRSIKIIDQFTCTSASAIYCITCTLCKKLYVGETVRPLGDRFGEQLGDVETTKTHLNRSQDTLISPIILSSNSQVGNVSGIHQINTESRRALEFFFQISWLS